METGMQE